MEPTQGCKVCHALDHMPEAQADELDQGLTRHSASAIARWLTANGHPVTTSSIKRHRSGECSLGLDYRRVAA